MGSGRATHLHGGDPAIHAKIWPVMCRAAALASNTTMPFMSSSTPSCCSGVAAMTDGPMDLQHSPAHLRGDETGHIAFTTMP